MSAKKLRSTLYACTVPYRPDSFHRFAAIIAAIIAAGSILITLLRVHMLIYLVRHWSAGTIARRTPLPGEHESRVDEFVGFMAHVTHSLGRMKAER